MQQHTRTVPAQHTTPDGPDRLRFNKLIGVELTYIDNYGQREEIMMLIPHGGGYLLPKGAYYQNGQMQVTLHLSDGDRAATVAL